MNKTICCYSFFKNNTSLYKKQFLVDCIKEATKKNQLKGTLITNDNIIFQIIEGHNKLVDLYIKQIKENNCHHNLTELINHSIKSYSFSKFCVGKYISDDIQMLYGIQTYIDTFKNLIPEKEYLFYDIVENLLLESV